MTVDDQIKAAMNKVHSVHTAKVRETAIRFLGNVSKATPVDTGRARANWNLTAGTPDLTTTENTFAPEAPDLSDYEGGKILYVSNGLPYIERLNDGYSKQAPANFVEEALQLAKYNAEAR